MAEWTVPDYKVLFMKAYRLLNRHHYVLKSEDWGRSCRVCQESTVEVEGVLYVGQELARLERLEAKP